MKHSRIYYLLLVIVLCFSTSCSKDDNPVNPGEEKDANFVSFSFTGIVGVATIDTNAGTITAVAESTVDMTTIKPIFTLSPNATAKVAGITQISGTTQNDFTTPVNYLVVSGDGTNTKNWTITITKEGDLVTTLTNDIINDGNKTLKKGTYIVEDYLSLEVGNTLTIQPGTIIKFSSGTSMYITEGATLKAVGTPASPILFTSNRSSQKAGDWHGLVIKSSGNEFEYCIFEYAGGHKDYGALTIESEVSIKNCTFRDSKYHGLLLADAGAEFSNFSNNSFVRCAENEANFFPICTEYINSLKNFGDGNIFENTAPNKGVLIKESYLEENVTLKKINAPYVLASFVYMNSDAVATLTIEAGVDIKMMKNAGIYIGNSGKIIAKGTENNHIKITGFIDQKGYWDYLAITGEALDGSIFEYCDISGGGSHTEEWQGAIYLYGTNADQITIKNCHISKTKGYGIYYHEDSEAITQDNTFSECELGNTNK